MKNKRGWVKIVEAFISVLLVAGALLIVINQGYIGKSSNSEKIYEVQNSILREIELNEDLRTEILGITDGDVLTDTNKTVIKIDERLPDYLKCVAKVCALDAICELKSEDSEDVPTDKNIYAHAVAIAVDETTFNPKQLKLFCWVI